MDPKRRPGRTREHLRKKAENAGMSTEDYARKVTRKGSKASTKTKREDNLSKTLAKLRKKKK